MSEPQGLGVLLVDDEPHVTSALGLALRRHGYNIKTANSAAAALAVMETAPIDVVVSDQQMPGTTGSRFLTQVLEKYPDTVRIILSGQASAQAMLDAINEAHVFRFHTKPCKADELAISIAEGIDARTARTRDAEAHKTESQVVRVRRRAVLDDALRGLWMAIQPIVSTRDGVAFGHEALVRSDHAELPTPDRLFREAHDLNLITGLERTIRGVVAGMAAEIPGDAAIFVNVHPRSLMDDDLFAADSPLAPIAHRIVLEITEHEKLQGVPGILEKLALLRKVGYRLAVDDLGSGYSSLTSFATMRPDFVKFDMEFIRDIQSSPIKGKLMRSMTTLCTELGIRTIAEGIETEAEYREAAELGCDFVQGYFIARPERMLLPTPTAGT